MIKKRNILLITNAQKPFFYGLRNEMFWHLGYILSQPKNNIWVIENNIRYALPAQEHAQLIYEWIDENN